MSRQTIMSAVFALADGVGGVRKRNEALPVTIPDGGLVIMRDGEPGEPTVLLGRPNPIEIYRHVVRFELYSDAAVPETEIYGMVDQIGAAVRADRSLGGLVEGIEVSAPEIQVIATEAGAAVVVGTIDIRVRYVLEAV